MNKLKRYVRTFFAPAVLREAFDAFEKIIRTNPTLAKKDNEATPELKISCSNLLVEKGTESITHDTEEEFFADYRKSPDRVTYYKNIGSAQLSLHFHNGGSDVQVICLSRQAIDAAFDRFEESAAKSRLPEPPKPAQPPPPKIKVFIGHGHSTQWRDLKDHLVDKHHIEVVAYEVGSRAGHTIRDVLEDMLTKSSIAFIVFTGEDRDDEGHMHSRENVVHEAGLFQGRLGFSRAIVVLEEGTIEFSNIHGIDQLRFSRGNIKEVFGDILAVIKREFGEPV